MVKRISANCQFIGRARAARKNGDELFQPGPASYDRSLSGVSIDFINTANRVWVPRHETTGRLIKAILIFSSFIGGSSPRSTVSGTTSVRITPEIRLGLISFVESWPKGWSWCFLAASRYVYIPREGKYIKCYSQINAGYILVYVF